MKKIISITILILLVATISGIKNPSAVYCEEMGYEFIINSTEQGEEGLCRLPDGTEVSAWDFLKGKVATEFSYCEKNGYELIVARDEERCSSIFSYDCAVCVKDGQASEVTKLMELNFNEGECGDGVCVMGETPETCPQDCPSGAEDYYCDGIADGICDPDCKFGEDPDCSDYSRKQVEDFFKEDEISKTSLWKSNTSLLILGMVLFAGLIIFAVIMFRKLRHNK
jgi:putative hemolysin